MTWEYLPAVLTAVTAVLVAFGGGIKWMISRMDAQDKLDRDWQENEREKLEKQFNLRIKNLEDEVVRQNDQIKSTKTELKKYIRHVGVLEGLLKANGLDVPRLDLSS